MLLYNLFRSLSLFILLAVATGTRSPSPGPSSPKNTPNYDAAVKSAGQQLLLHHAYGFREGNLIEGFGPGHVRLVIVWPEGEPGNMDITAAMFELINDKKSGKDKSISFRCTWDSKKDWDFQRGGPYEYLGEVQPIHSETSIAQASMTLISTLLSYASIAAC